ncbi:Uncharacterized protein Fot_40456 [Forsythia ovata]|uniref:Uncharacterized protein n=1 Tax=Forsythia ovata TaxID=205694 RepID=A0ABD1S7H4_9LAMI
MNIDSANFKGKRRSFPGNRQLKSREAALIHIQNQPFSRLPNLKSSTTSPALICSKSSQIAALCSSLLFARSQDFQAAVVECEAKQVINDVQGLVLKIKTRGKRQSAQNKEKMDGMQHIFPFVSLLASCWLGFLFLHFK